MHREGEEVFVIVPAAAGWVEHRRASDGVLLMSIRVRCFQEDRRWKSPAHAGFALMPLVGERLRLRRRTHGLLAIEAVANRHILLRRTEVKKLAHARSVIENIRS